MSRSPVAIDENRARTRLLFEAGVVSAADVTAWADGKIALDSNPSQELIALSMASPDRMEALLKTYALPDPADTLAIVSCLYQANLLSLEDSWNALARVAQQDLSEPLAFSDDRLWDVFADYDSHEDFPNLSQEAKELLHTILTGPA